MIVNLGLDVDSKKKGISLCVLPQIFLLPPFMAMFIYSLLKEVFILVALRNIGQF